MLHAPKLERRYQDEFELAEGIGNAGVRFELFKRRRMKIEYGVAIALHFPGIGFAVEHSERPPAAFGFFGLESASRKGEEVRGNRRGLAIPNPDAVADRFTRRFRTVRNGKPVGWNGQIERIACFQIRLIEDGKYRVGERGHEQGVQELRVAVKRWLSGSKGNLHGVLTGIERFGSNDNVSVDVLEADIGTLHGYRLHKSGITRRSRIRWRRKIEYQRCRRVLEGETGRDPSIDGLVDRFGDVERQFVAEVPDCFRAMGRKRDRYAWIGQVYLGHIGRARTERERKERENQGRRYATGLWHRVIITERPAGVHTGNGDSIGIGVR